MQDEKNKVAVITLGCKVNQYESEAISEELERRGFSVLPESDACMAYIINTCTVTAESDRKARQTVRRVIKRDPNAFVLLCGCYAQSSPDDLARITGVDYICGSSNKMTIADKLCELSEKNKKNESPEICVPELAYADFEEMSIEKFERTRAYVKIEDGCESRCTYCAIPDARGPIRSKPPEQVLCEIRRLVSSGCCEVVLTGIETGSYGRDLEPRTTLADLLVEVDKIEGLRRVRLGSLDPTTIRPEFVNKISPLHTVVHHFHLSLQSGSDNVLARMRRKYNSARAMESISLLRKAFPDLQLTTDCIVGFPSESEEDLLATAELIRRAKFLTVHVFPYSKRQGTPAADMPGQIPEHIKRERVHAISSVSEEVRREILDRLVAQSTECDLLCESYSDGYNFGHTSEFIEVKLKHERDLHAVCVRVRLISHDGNVCEGVLVDLCDVTKTPPQETGGHYVHK